MLPKITRNKFSSPYEKSQYYDDLLKGYIHLNENTSEPITEYNTMCIDMISSAIRKSLNPTIVKLAIIGKLAYKAKDYGTNRNCYQIISSLQSQRKYFSLCENILKKAAINKNYYIIIKYNFNKGVVNRCERLNESLLPNLIEESKLNVYVDYLAEKGITLESELEKYAEYGFSSEEFLHYVDLVEERIERHLNSVSEEKKSELLAGYEKQKLLTQQRNEAKAVSKDIKKADDLREIKESLSGKVTQIFDNAMLVKTTYMRTGSIAQKLYQRLDALIENKGIDTCLKDRVVVIALHPRSKSFSTANIKYHVAGRKALTNDIVLATMLLEKYDAQYIQGVVDTHKEKYIIDLAYVYKADDYIQGVGASRLAELHKIEEEKNRKHAERAISLGLNENATDEEIAREADNQLRVKKALSLGLNKTATWKDINAVIMEQSRIVTEKRLKEEAERADIIKQSISVIPPLSADLMVITHTVADYEKGRTGRFNSLIPLLNQFFYVNCNISYLSYIDETYYVRYCYSLYVFTKSIYIYYKNLQGVVYKLNNDIKGFKDSNKDFDICLSNIEKHKQYYCDVSKELAVYYMKFYLSCLEVIKSEGFSLEKAFRDCPLLERYYREYLHSDLTAFVEFIGFTTGHISHCSYVVSKIKKAF